MAETLPLDAVLEQLVAALVDLTASAEPQGEVLVTGGSWEAVFDIEDETFFFDLVPLSRDSFEALDDYQLSVLYALGLEPVHEPDEGPLLRQEYEYDAGEQWEEEAIRQLGQLALGLLRDVVRVPAPEALLVRSGA